MIFFTYMYIQRLALSSEVKENMRFQLYCSTGHFLFSVSGVLFDIWQASLAAFDLNSVREKHINYQNGVGRT